MESTYQSSRYCVSCGRSIAWDANVCPYCGHDYRYPANAQVQEHISSGLRVVFYFLSFLFWIAGLVIGLIYLTKNDPESKQVGKMALIFMAFGIVFQAVLAVVLWIVVTNAFL